MKRSKRVGMLLPVCTCCVVAGVTMTSPAIATAITTTWLPAQQLSGTSENGYSPVIAADAQGTALAVWEGYDGTNYRIEARSRPPGGSFSTPQFLSAAGATAQSPSVAFDSQGNAMAVWSRNGIVEYATRPPGGVFGAGQALSSGGEDSEQPKVVFDSQGDAIVLWESRVVAGMGMTIWIRDAVRPAGGSFGSAKLLDTRSSSSIMDFIGFGSLGLAADGQGNVHAVWAFDEMNTSFMTMDSSYIEAASAPAGSPLGGATQLASAMSFMSMINRVDSPVVAADPQGDALVLWDSNVGGMTETVDAKIRVAGGTFETNPETVSGNGLLPQVAFDRHGNAIAVFQGPVSGTVTAQDVLRPAGGGFGSPQSLDPGVMSYSPAVAVTPTGEAIAAWQEANTLEAAVRPAGASFGMPAPISASGGNPSGESLATDGQGDAVAIWNRIIGSYRVAELAAFDGAAPVLQSVTIPSQGIVGSPLTFSAGWLGIWAPVTSTIWGLGDGASASGATVSHAYGAVGTYPVTVTATDAVGNSSTTGGSTHIAAAPPGGPGGATTKASIAMLAMLGETNSVFAVGPTPTPLSGQSASTRHQRGTVFSYQLDQPATMKIAIQAKARGRRVGRTCRADSPRLHRKPRCSRTITIATLTRTSHTGRNKVAFSGRIGGRALKPGRYQAIFTAVDSAGASPPKALGFTIVKR
jgi:hypothetical protein